MVLLTYTPYKQNTAFCLSKSPRGLHSTIPSITCLRLSDASVICRVIYFQFLILAERTAHGKDFELILSLKLENFIIAEL